MSDEEFDGFGAFVATENAIREAQPAVAADPGPPDDLGPPDDMPDQARKPVKRTPHEWAERKGLFTKSNKYVPQAHDYYDWTHGCADLLHKWSEHDYHYSDNPTRLTERQYDAAREAAANYPNTKPFQPAIMKGRK